MFNFKGYEIDREKALVTFRYELVNKDESFSFTEKLFFDKNLADFSRAPESVLKSTLDTLHILLGISYWKLFCPKDIKLETITLSEDQARFWNTVYTKGLGEFFYQNQIDFRGLVSFPFTDKAPVLSEPLKTFGKSLVLWGGGKDSVVTAELLKSKKFKFDLFSLNEYEIQKKAAEVCGEKLLIVKREIDPLLLKLNEREDVYNGHVPVTFVYSASAILAAILYGYEDVISSCEESANYGNVEYLGQTINHQWSKSFEFEVLLRDYIEKYISPSLTYVSLIRVFHEIKVAELFSKHAQYFQSFSSCNRNFKIAGKSHEGNWCCECAKCAFVFSILSAFLPKEKVLNIFGQNLYDNENLTQTFEELLGVKNVKPFDCVGTPEEVKLAMLLAHKRGEYSQGVIMKMFVEKFYAEFDEIEKTSETLLKRNVEITLQNKFIKIYED